MRCSAATADGPQSRLRQVGGQCGGASHIPGLEPQAEPVLEPYKRQILDGLYLQRETPQGLVMHCLSHRTACIIESHRGASERLTRGAWEGSQGSLGETDRGAWERLAGELGMADRGA